MPDEMYREQGINKAVLTDTAGLGIFLWFIGWLSSLILYFYIPVDLLGWVLFVIFTPITIVITLVWFRKRALSLKYYLSVAITWTAIAILFDYLFIVLLFRPPDYYHLSVIVYYLETFMIPFMAGVFYHKEPEKS